VPTKLKARVAVVLGLGLAPVVFLCVLGLLYLRGTGWWWYAAYGGMAGCWLAAYLLGRYWTRRPVKPPTAAEPPPNYWTDRDRRAWEIVEEHVAATTSVTAEQFGDHMRYAKDAEQLALKVARVYQPKATDPFGHLTLPEILACGELVSEDLSKLVNQYVPGSHLLSVNDLKQIRTAVDQVSTWYPRLRNIYWAAAAVFYPLQTAAQVLATKAGLAPAFAGFQNNVLLWFHTAYVRELGRYLVELNSGRLKVGARRYRELMALHKDPGEAAEKPVEPSAPSDPKPQNPNPKPQTPAITVALVGPVKAGKSSLVNALLGEERAATDVLPLTPGATRYTLNKPGEPTLSIMDTAGFGNDGPTEEDVMAAAAAAGQADVLLLVVPARSAARRPESEFLDRVRAGVAAAPQLRMPPTLVVLSHADLLTPAREWAPPYDWRSGQRPKEVSIREAATAAKEVFGDRAADILPVVTAPGKVFGVKEDLVPTIAGFLGEARGVGLLRTLHAEASADRYKRVATQLLNAGGQVFKALWESGKK
jgi:predicted GTPase